MNAPTQAASPSSSPSLLLTLGCANLVPHPQALSLSLDGGGLVSALHRGWRRASQRPGELTWLRPPLRQSAGGRAQ